MAHRLLAKLSTISGRTPSGPTSAARATNEWSVSDRPPATMTPGPLPVVRNDPGADFDEDCIICGESLSFSFRLPGEKPHIVPECGHALHEACFTAVYGQLPSSRMGALPRKNLGVCGVCRKPIRVGDGDSAKSNKLAALTGMGDKNAGGVFPGRESTVAGPSRYTPTPRLAPTPVPHDPSDDDPLEPIATTNASIRSGGSSGNSNSDYVVAPAISVRSEFPSITRVHEPTQSITCLITVELPSRRGSAPVPGPVISATPPPRYDSPPPPRSEDVPGPYSYNPTPPANSRFARAAEDLQTRLVDWKGHPMGALGPLQMFDVLSVRRDSLVREFYVYLFREAIICVLEEKKKSLGRLLASGNSGSFDAASLASSSPGFANKSVLRLKGRIYIRHIKRLLDTSVAGELSLTIDMEDERLESFILIFRDRASLEEWRATIQSLVNAQHAASNLVIQDLVEFGSSAGRPGPNKGTRARSAATTASSLGTESILNSGPRSTVSSSSSGPAYAYAKSPELPQQQHYLGPSPHVSPHVSAGPSNTLPPLPHAPIDLIAVVSLPAPNAHASTAQLKLRVIRTTLDFLVASLGPRDRLALVTFQAGKNGRVRKTPFLNLGKPGSVARMSGFIESTASRTAEENFNDGSDEFWVKTGKDEVVDVVTAVNHGLDSVLQRKQKNPISGMVLVCDAADSSRKPQMDLLMARTEAANLPIHSFGFGRSHDPGPLWLISNATGGSYTFVRDWYELRDCVAGCVGGMMSIGVMNLRMHAKVLDDARFSIRKVAGVSGAVVARDGMNVDVVLGALHFGERRELVVELELDNRVQSAPLDDIQPGASMDATHAFVQRMGLDTLSLSDAALGEGMLDALIDEAPVFEVDGAFFDPGAGKTVSRLAHPVLLTLAIHPPATASYPRGGGQQVQAPNQGWSDATIVRRRAELLSHQMIMRAIVFVGRRDYAHAVQLLVGTRTALTNILNTSLPPPTSRQTRKELLTLAAVRTIQSVMGDVQVLIDALEENPDGFNRDWRPFGAQQVSFCRI
ncbi:hypothetical protein FRC10_000931 [Ceratobasidium sp. 414]|nr:hypothetical protein FRC10_000931 [Ceratobasidium sp. 414]